MAPRGGGSVSIASKAFLALACVLLASCASRRASIAERELASEYLSVADAYAELGKHEKAVEFYLRARKIPEFRNATSYSLGRMYALSGKWREAVDMFEALHREEPENARVSAAYAFALVSTGETERALAVYEAAYVAKRDDPTTNRDYAEMLLIAGKPEEAINHIALVREGLADTKVASDLDSIEKRALEAIAARTKAPDAKKGADANKPAL